MSDHFKNKPIQNWYSGIFTGLYYAFFITASSAGFQYLGGRNDEKEEALLSFIAFGVGTIIFFFLKRKFDKSAYEEIERNLDD